MHDVEQAKVIFSYSWQEAVADGLLVRLWMDNLECLAGKPVLATAGICHDLEPDEQRRLIEDYLVWHERVEPMLPEEERLFAATASTGEKVWVIDDGSVVTLLYPHEY